MNKFWCEYGSHTLHVNKKIFLTLWMYLQWKISQVSWHNIPVVWITNKVIGGNFCHKKNPYHFKEEVLLDHTAAALVLSCLGFYYILIVLNIYSSICSGMFSFLFLVLSFWILYIYLIVFNGLLPHWQSYHATSFLMW